MNRLSPRRLAPIAGALLLLAASAQAGTAANATVSGKLSISDAAGYSWNLDFAPLLSVDASTGNIVVNTAFAAAGVEGGNGLWTTSANSGAGAVKVRTAQGVNLTPDTVISWHSWMRADGTVGTDTAGGTNPWRTSFNFYAAGNVDPDMSYGFSVRNNTASSQTYIYTQGESLVPPAAGAFNIYADIGGSVVNNTANGTPGLSLGTTSANGGKVQQVWLGNGNTATSNAGVGVGDAFNTNAAATSNYGTFATSNAGAGAYDYWEFQTQFTLSGGRDVASVTGYAELTSVVPEPGSYALLALGLALVGFQIRRQPR